MEISSPKATRGRPSKKKDTNIENKRKKQVAQSNVQENEEGETSVRTRRNNSEKIEIHSPKATRNRAAGRGTQNAPKEELKSNSRSKVTQSSVQKNEQEGTSPRSSKNLEKEIFSPKVTRGRVAGSGTRNGPKEGSKHETKREETQPSVEKSGKYEDKIPSPNDSGVVGRVGRRVAQAVEELEALPKTSRRKAADKSKTLSPKATRSRAGNEKTLEDSQSASRSRKGKKPSNTDVEKGNEEPSEVAAESPRKGRGRPRLKVAGVEETSTAEPSEVAAESPRRGRGRTRVKVAGVEETSTAGGKRTAAKEVSPLATVSAKRSSKRKNVTNTTSEEASPPKVSKKDPSPGKGKKEAKKVKFSAEDYRQEPRTRQESRRNTRSKSTQRYRQ